MTHHSNKENTLNEHTVSVLADRIIEGELISVLVKQGYSDLYISEAIKLSDFILDL
jgi:hypothetical protein